MDEAAVVWVTPEALHSYDSDDELPSEFGAKARGLVWLPRAWVPPFFVVSPAVHREFKQRPPSGRTQLIAQIAPLFREAVAKSTLESRAVLFLRSNAVRETLRERGKYASVRANPSEIAAEIFRFYEQLDSVCPVDGLGVIVQQYVPPAMKGHLSNERRVAEEYRDALIQFEDTNGGLSEERISFRRWRSERHPDDGALTCASRDDLPSALRQPLAFCARQVKRVHFEWVWDGRFVHIVQADIADDRLTGGVNPEAVARNQKIPDVSESNLRLFRWAPLDAATTTGKLRNHSIYKRHGFWQPPFYQLDSPSIIEGILRGHIDDRLASDLAELTTSPLIIRTSSSTPGFSLLPRSNQLTSQSQAIEWLCVEFGKRIRESGVDSKSISLLAHHYIPASVAAFSVASAERLEVYIEALWGIPEGLYYYPFDAYTVHTVGIDPDQISDSDLGRFQNIKRRRFKSHFVAPNELGQFVCHELARPWDWKLTIDNPRDLGRIAAFTRRLAKEEGYPVNVMWFLSCSAKDGVIPLVPWYHERLASAPSELAFQRNARDEVVTISTEKDLQALEQRSPSENQSQRLNRLVIELSPVEDQAIRNESFARRVGDAARILNAVVILQGASLSHIYYVLSRTGAEIVVRHAADSVVRREVHEKLVRDKIPAAVAATGETAHFANLGRAETLAALRMKIVEEAFEVRDSNRDELLGELADVIEVVRAIARVSGISLRKLESVRRSKATRRGGFEDGVVLLSTATGEAAPSSNTLLSDADEDFSRVIQTDRAPRLERVSAGAADVRDTPEFVEFVQNGTVALTHPEWTLNAPRRASLPRNFSIDYLDWSIDGQRKGSTLKLRIKIKVGSSQLEFPLERLEDG